MYFCYYILDMMVWVFFDWTNVVYLWLLGFPIYEISYTIRSHQAINVRNRTNIIFVYKRYYCILYSWILFISFRFCPFFFLSSAKQNKVLFMSLETCCWRRSFSTFSYLQNDYSWSFFSFLVSIFIIFCVSYFIC